jgi:hypothetical protein
MEKTIGRPPDTFGNGRDYDPYGLESINPCWYENNCKIINNDYLLENKYKIRNFYCIFPNNYTFEQKNTVINAFYQQYMNTILQQTTLESFEYSIQQNELYILYCNWSLFDYNDIYPTKLHFCFMPKEIREKFVKT